MSYAPDIVSAHVDPATGVARALLPVSGSLDVFGWHFPKYPVLPGVFVLRAFGQLAHTTAPGTLLAIDDVRFRRPVRPGDVLELDLSPVSCPTPHRAWSCLARIDTTRVVTVRSLTWAPQPPEEV